MPAIRTVPPPPESAPMPRNSFPTPPGDAPESAYAPPVRSAPVSEPERDSVGSWPATRRGPVPRSGPATRQRPAEPAGVAAQRWRGQKRGPLGRGQRDHGRARHDSHQREDGRDASDCRRGAAAGGYSRGRDQEGNHRLRAFDFTSALVGFGLGRGEDRLARPSAGGSDRLRVRCAIRVLAVPALRHRRRDQHGGDARRLFGGAAAHGALPTGGCARIRAGSQQRVRAQSGLDVPRARTAGALSSRRRPGAGRGCTVVKARRRDGRSPDNRADRGHGAGYPRDLRPEPWLGVRLR